MDYVWLVTYLFVAIGFSFLCSIAEAVLLSITPSYIAERERNPSKSAKRVVSLKSNIDRPLAAILSLNTIAHTIGAAGVGAQAAHIYGDRYVGLISAILTLLILVLSEIIPKTIGALHWRRLADPVAYFVPWLIFLMLPLVWLSEFLTKALVGDRRADVVTRAEIAAIAALGSKAGLLRNTESHILRNLPQLESVVISEIMTPNTVVISMEESLRLSEASEMIQSLPVSRVPIYRERRDAVTGFVLKSELLSAIVAGEEDKALRDYSRPIKAVRETDKAFAIFEQLLEAREHIAIVTDDFGGLEGLVTLEDLIETLIGSEIVDEHDEVVDMQQLARKNWSSRQRGTGRRILEQTNLSTPQPAPLERPNGSFQLIGPTKNHANDLDR
ncbi:MAG: DUF21 domain-containing protein [Planctomycetales bacterium]|nr:DUF21 domain-containing protein [Planctomycetales bacterium]